MTRLGYRALRLRRRMGLLPGARVLGEAWDRATFPVRRALCAADLRHGTACRGVTTCPWFLRVLRGEAVSAPDGMPTEVRAGLVVRPGDAVLLAVGSQVDGSEVDALMAWLAERFPDVRFVVLGGVNDLARMAGPEGAQP